MSGVLFFLKCCAIGLAISIPGVLIFNKVREWWKAEEATEAIERAIPLSLFLASYEREPEKWIPLKYYVIFKNDRMKVDVTFRTAKERSRYRKWYESRKKQEEQERIDERNRKLMDSIAEGYMESVTVESKPVEAEVPAEREWSVRRCYECIHCFVQSPETNRMICFNRDRAVQYSYDQACEWFMDAKEREKVKQ